jgi:DNA-binding MarR family transcriptional regulator
MTGRRNISSLDAHVGFWLRFVSNHVSHAFERRLEAHGVSVAEWVILRDLYAVDTLPSELAQRLGMTRGAISKLVARLESRKLVTRQTDDFDRRYQPLAITAKGRALVPVLAAVADDNDEEFFGHLRREQREQMIDVMKEIVARLGLQTTPVD